MYNIVVLQITSSNSSSASGNASLTTNISLATVQQKQQPDTATKMWTKPSCHNAIHQHMLAARNSIASAAPASKTLVGGHQSLQCHTVQGAGISLTRHRNSHSSVASEDMATPTTCPSFFSWYTAAAGASSTVPAAQQQQQQGRTALLVNDTAGKVPQPERQLQVLWAALRKKQLPGHIFKGATHHSLHGATALPASMVLTATPAATRAECAPTH